MKKTVTLFFILPLLLIVAAGCRSGGEAATAAAAADAPLTLADALDEAERHLAAVRDREFRQQIQREHENGTLMLRLSALLAAEASADRDFLRRESRAALELAIRMNLLFAREFEATDEAGRARTRQLLAGETAELFSLLQSTGRIAAILERHRALLGESAGFRAAEFENLEARAERQLELRTLTGRPAGSLLILSPTPPGHWPIRADALLLADALPAALAQRPEFAENRHSPAALADAALALRALIPPATADSPAARGFYLAGLLLRLPRQLEIRRLEERPTTPELTLLAMALGVAAQLDIDLAAGAEAQKAATRAGEEALLLKADLSTDLAAEAAAAAAIRAAVRLRTDLGLPPDAPTPAAPPAADGAPPDELAAAIRVLGGILAGQQL